MKLGASGKSGEIPICIELLGPSQVEEEKTSCRVLFHVPNMPKAVLHTITKPPRDIEGCIEVLNRTA